MNDLRRFVKNGVRNPKHYFIRVVGGTSSSESVSSEPVNTDPEIYKFKTGHSTYSEGSKVKFTASGDNYDKCEISIYRDSELVKNVTVKNGTYLFSADVAGDYSASCVLTSDSSDKKAESKKITFRVNEKPEVIETEETAEEEVTEIPEQTENAAAEVFQTKEVSEIKSEKSEPQKINAVAYGAKADVKTITSQLANAKENDTAEKAEDDNASKWLLLALMFGLWF